MTRTHKRITYISNNARREENCHWVSGYTFVEYGHNVTKYHYIERKYYECTKAEADKMCEQLDSRAMDKEWKRMQDTVEQETE